MIRKTIISEFVLLAALVGSMIILFTTGEESAIAVANSDNGRSVEKSVKNDVTIQQAIDNAAKNGGGDVYIPAGKYYISNTVVIKSSVRLELSSAAMLIPTRNINLVEMKRNSGLQGGILYPYGYAKFSQSAIFLNGAEKFSGTMNSAVIEDVRLIGRLGMGNGLFMYAGKGNGNVSWVQVHNLNVAGFDKAIHLKTEPVEKPNMVWVNGNNFSQILIKDTVYGIYIDGHSYLPYEISGNNFSNVQIQTTKDTKKAIYVKGTKNYIQAMIWDYHNGADAIYLDEDSQRNQIYSNVSSKEEGFIDLGENNLAVTAE